MEVKTWEEFASWARVQFPVLAAAALVAWGVAWGVVHVLNRRHDAELDRIGEKHKEVLAAKDQQIEQREAQLRELVAEKDKQLEYRDAQIRELKSEKDKLMGLKYPSWNDPKGAGGGPQS